VADGRALRREPVRKRDHLAEPSTSRSFRRCLPIP
jgi:hypothetical protein